MNKAPTFLIIGERRSGTTTLAKWVKEHPEIFLHPRFDLGYFIDSELVGSRTYRKGKVDYTSWAKTHSKEAYEALFDAADQQLAIGEKSADYLFLEQCHSRINTFYPNIKLLITLRNPTDRAWSMYWNEVGKGRESLSFEDAIDAENQRISASDYAKDHLSYFNRGIYINSLKKLFETFPRERVYITLLDHLMNDPINEMKKVYDFLGVDPEKGMEIVGKQFNRNWTVTPRPFVQKSAILSAIDGFYYEAINKFANLIHKDTYARRRLIVRLASPFREKKASKEMSKATRAMLQSRFAQHNKELELFLNKKIPW